MGFTKSRLKFLKDTGVRSGLEDEACRQLDSGGFSYGYEQVKIQYIKPPSSYKLDFNITTKSGKEIWVETKGRFMPVDRTKHLLIKQQHPEVDIRFVFQDPNTKLSKKSKTTYGQWCTKHGFKFAKADRKNGVIIPKEWLDE